VTIKAAKKYFTDHSFTYGGTIVLLAISCALLDIIG
jgi:hypothetical protein